MKSAIFELTIVLNPFIKKRSSSFRLVCKKGYKVLRIYNNDLKENFEAVLELIYSRLNE